MKLIKYSILVLVGTLLFVGCGCSQKSDVVPKKEIGSGENLGYKLVWEDLFTEPTLNEENWNIEVNGNGGGNLELQYYRKENISIGNEPSTKKSCLIITAKKENFGGKSFTSGRLTTKNKKYFKYGKVEASIKLPKTKNGLWPAFWMMGNDFDQVGWPRSGEIDILEMGHSNGIKNNTQETLLNGACHWGPTWQNNPSYAYETIADYSLQDDFHLYTMLWDDQAVKMYIDLDKYPDAKPYFQMSITNTANDKSPGLYFHKEFFVLLNLAVGGRFTGILSADGITALPNESANMYVDYVKVYQK